LLFDAMLDFDYLLGLEHREDLRTLDNFCKVKVRPRYSEGPPSRLGLSSLYDRAAQEVEDFVVRELTLRR